MFLQVWKVVAAINHAVITLLQSCRKVLPHSWQDFLDLQLKARAAVGDIEKAQLAAGPSSSPGHGNRVWFHVASAGELEQAIPLMQELFRRATSDQPMDVWVSYFSPSAIKFLKNLPPEVTEKGRVFPLPLESWSLQSRLFRAIRPTHLVLVKYELWPLLLCCAREFNVSVVLMGAVSAWTRATAGMKGRLYRPYLRWAYSHLAAVLTVRPHDAVALRPFLRQSQILEAVGDPKWQRALERVKRPPRPEFHAVLEAARSGMDRHRSAVTTTDFVTFGSPHAEEWSIFERFCRDHPHIGILLAPHDVRGEAVQRLLAGWPPSIQARTYRLSQHLSPSASASLHADPTMTASGAVQGSVQAWLDSLPAETAPIFVVDLVGILAELYALAPFAVIGGGFDGALHNSLEPAAQGAIPLFGPFKDRFPEASLLSDAGAALSFMSPDALLRYLSDWAVDVGERGRDSASVEWVLPRRAMLKTVFDTIGNPSAAIADVLQRVPLHGYDSRHQPSLL